jgi:SAM-dependent methyltransferase
MKPTKENSFIQDNFYPTKKHPLFIIRNGIVEKVKKHQHLLTGNLLDFGCGAKPYQKLFTNITQYVGVDYMGEGHEHKGEKIDFFYDGKTLPFETATFNSIFATEVFEHIFNLEEILIELNRVLKLKGKIFITCPFVWNEHEVPNDYARYTLFALESLLNKSGFEIEIKDKSGDFILTISQMKILYFNDHFVPRLPKLIRKICRHLITPILNNYYVIKHKLLPKNDSLYLNNIVIAKKIR